MAYWSCGRAIRAGVQAVRYERGTGTVCWRLRQTGLRIASTCSVVQLSTLHCTHHEQHPFGSGSLVRGKAGVIGGHLRAERGGRDIRGAARSGTEGRGVQKGIHKAVSWVLGPRVTACGLRQL